MPEIWLIGLIAGLAATVVMTVMMKMVMGSEPGLPQLLVGKVMGKSPSEVMMPAMVGHFSYGLGAGVIGMYLFELAGITWPFVVWGLIWGFVLALGAMMQVMAFGMIGMVKENPKMPMMVIVMHLVWGLVFGGVVTLF